LSVELEAASFASPKRVVLVVEDEVVVRNVICVILQREGHKVLAAADGLEALQVARTYNGTIDLMVSDVEMPRLGGLELVDRILTERPEVRVLLISGKMSTAMPDDKKDIPFLRKPFRSKELLATIGEVLKPRA
jgi:hypothetical protein